MTATPIAPSLFFLLGFMGAGKSTLGRQAARRLGLRFVDLDAFIEKQTGMSVPAFFENQGEAAFRAWERKSLEALFEASKNTDEIAENPTGVLVSLGGGTPCFGDNMAWLNAHGTTLYLRHSAGTLYGRLRIRPERRPLIANVPPHQLASFIANLLARREPYYSMAQYRIDSPNVKKLTEKLTELLTELRTFAPSNA